MRRFLNEMALGETTEVVLNGDNESSLSSTKNPEVQNRKKHIDVQHHYLPPRAYQRKGTNHCLGAERQDASRWIHKSPND